MSFWLFSCYLNRFEAILLATHWKRLGFGYAGIIYGFFLNLNSGVCFDATKTNIPVYLIHLPNKIQINREISSNLMTSKFLSLIFRFFRSIMSFPNFWHKICNVLKKKLHSRSICSISPWKNWMRADIRRKKTAASGITKASSPWGLQMWVRPQRCRFCGVRIQNRSSKQYMLPPRLTPVTAKIANMTNKMIK